MGKIYFPISIDMGSTSTGVYTTSYKRLTEGVESLEDFKERNKKGQGFLINNGNLSTSTYDQSARRTFRASRKALKRRKNSKRLALLILESLGISLNSQQEESLRFLMNRRGFTYLEVQAKDQDKIHNLYHSLEEEFFTEEFLGKIEFYNSLVREKKWVSSDKWNLLKALLKENAFPFPALEEEFDLWLVIISFLSQVFSEEREREDSFVLEESLTEALLEVFLSFYNKGKYWFALRNDKEKKGNLREKEELFFSSLSQEQAQVLLDIEKKMEGTILKNSLEAILKEFKEGKRSRERAFNELKEDLLNPKTSAYDLFDQAIKPKLTFNEFMNLLANVINLQNRYLRQYFQYGKDYPFLEKGDTWESQRAYHLYQKYIKRVFQSHQKEIFSYLEAWEKSPKNDNFAWALTQIPYEKTIPPFESNNNRNTPKCSHIYLNYAWLVDNLQGREDLLREFSLQLKDLYPEYAKGLPIFPLGKENKTLLWIREESLIFHRFLDSTKLLLNVLLQRIQGEGSYNLEDNLHFLIIGNLSFSEPEKEVLKNLIKKSRLEQIHIKKLEKDIVFEENGKIQECTLSRAYDIEDSSLIKDSPFILCNNHPPLKGKRKKSYLKKYFSFGEEESVAFFEALERKYTQQEAKKDNLKSSHFYHQVNQLKELRDSLGNYLNLTYRSCEKKLKDLFQEGTYKVSHKYFSEKELLSERGEILISLVTYLSQEFYSVYSKSLTNKGLEVLSESELSPWKNGGESFGLKVDKKGYEIQKCFLIHPSLLLQLIDILLSSHGKGFAKECSCCHSENQWRTSFEAEQEGVEEILIRGQRSLPLSKGGDIPFSGKIRRFCDALALRVMKTLFPLLKTEIEGSSSQDSLSLHIPLFVEKNSFSFEEVIGKKKKKKKEAKKEENLSAVQRPLSAITLSPYKGGLLQEGDIEYDHILSRSFSRHKESGLVFNTQVNLIPCTSKENKEKGSGWVSLDNLNFNHMEQVFGDLAKEGDYSQVKDFIRNRLDPYFNKKKRYYNFKRLNEEDKRAFRYVLFTWQEDFLTLEEKNWIVFHILKMSATTRVNGTQRYFLQSLKKKWEQALIFYRKEKGLPSGDLNVSFTLLVVDPSDYRKSIFSDFRKNLRNKISEKEETLKKEEEQKPYSHILDAYLIYNMGYFFLNSRSSQKAMNQMEGIETGLSKSFYKEKDKEETTFIEEVLECLPKNYQIHFMDSLEIVNSKKTNKASKPLFKTTFYGERYLPLLISEEGLGFGFSLENSFLSDKEGFKSPLYSLLYPYIKDKKDLPTPQEVGENISFLPSYPYLRKFDRVEVQKFLTSRYHDLSFPKGKSLGLEEIFYNISYRTTRLSLSPSLPLEELKKIMDKDILKLVVGISLGDKKDKSIEEFFKVKFKSFTIKGTQQEPNVSLGKQSFLTLPYYRTWTELSKFYQQQKEDTPQECLKKALEKLEESFKRDQKPHFLKHGVKGKKLSLILPTAMGDLRIRRKDNKGKEFFQLFDSITKTKGFNLSQKTEGNLYFKESSLIFSHKISSFDPSSRALSENTLHKKDDIAIKEDWFIFDFSHNFLLKMGYSFPEAKRRDFLLRFSKHSPLWRKFSNFLEEEEAYQSLKTTPFSLTYKGEKSDIKEKGSKKPKNEMVSLARDFLDSIINEALKEAFPSLEGNKDLSIGSFNPGTKQVVYQVNPDFIDIFFRTAGSSSFDSMILAYVNDASSHPFSQAKEGNSYSHKKLKEDFFKVPSIKEEGFIF